ncbi:hypothetical protein MCOR25_008385 [Pyricularia grisea]|nr:hypothetical protein MCOR25_008385 [Pyricularia grisea]
MPSKRRSTSRPSSCSPSSSRRKRARLGYADPASEDNGIDMRDQPPMNESSDTAAESALLLDLPPSPSRDGKEDASPSTPISSSHSSMGQQAHVSDDQPASEDGYRQNGPIRPPSSHSEQSAASLHSQPQIDWRDVPVVYPFRRTVGGAWLPPYEPDRPKNPYHKGFQTTIYLHEPPLNDFLVDENDCIGPTPGIKDNRDLRLKTLVDACLSSQICRGTTFEDKSHQFEVVDEIAVRNTHGAQVVVCKLDGQPKTYVAKIYDPLYYSFPDQDLPHIPRSTTLQADRDYCNEANVYAGLRHTSLAGNEIPAYQGSFTFDIPLDLPEPRGRHMRPVRLIIMEHIEGAKTMENMDPSSLPARLRLEIMAQYFAARIAIMNCNVFHDDICPRNTLICLPHTVKHEKDDDGQDDAVRLRVVLFDFNISDYQWKPKEGRVWNDDGEQEYGPIPLEFWPKELPMHPTRAYWNKMLDFSGYRRWWPRSWRKAPSVGRWNAWLLKHHAATPVWEAVWDCLMAAKGPMEPSKEPITEDVLGPEEDEEGEDSPSEDEGENYDSEGYDQDAYDEQIYDQETYDREAYNREQYDQEKDDQEKDDQEKDDQEKDDQEKDDQEKDDQDTYVREADEQEAYEAEDEPEQDKASSEAQADVDPDAKDTERKEQQQMSSPLLEGSTASPENGPDAIKDDSTTTPPEAIVKDSVDQHPVSTHAEVVSQDGPSPSASADTTEHDERELVDDNNNGPR